MIARRTVRWAALAALPWLCGCIASNVVAVADREVPVAPAALAFAPATTVPDGLYESVDLTGDAAASLRGIWYLFRADGTYTAAALADVDGALSFQTLAGTWQATADGLVLDGASPVRLEQAQHHLRLTAPNGAVVLRRRSLQ